MHFPGLPDPDTYLAVICLVYLAAHTEELRDFKTTSRSLQTHHSTDPFLIYALEFWGIHVQAALKHGPLHPSILSLILVPNDHPILSLPGARAPREELWFVTSLHLAVMQGLTDVISLGTLPFMVAPDAIGYNPYHFAALYDQKEALGALFSSYGTDGMGTPSEFGHTPLLIASRKKHNPIADMILLQASNPNSGPLDIDPANINAQLPGNGATALICACRHRDVGLVRLLVSFPHLDVHLRDGVGGTTAFYDACMNDEIHELLVNFAPDVDVDIRDPNTGMTAFMHTCRGGSAKVVAWFLNRNREADPNFIQQTTDGWNALMILCRFSFDDARPQSETHAILELLIRHGSDFRQRDNWDKSTAFLWLAAAERKDDAFVHLGPRPPWNAERQNEWLEFHKIQASFFEMFVKLDPAVIRQRDRYGCTALMLVAEHSCSPEAIRYLLSHPEVDAAYINARDCLGRTALANARAHKFGYGQPAVDILLSDPRVIR